MQSIPIRTGRRGVFRTLPLLAILTLATGCGDAAGSGPHPEHLIEVSLGEFRVPLAPRSPWQPEEETTDGNRLLLRFKLHALVPPDHEVAVQRRMESHEVRFRDAVMNICRSATLDEVSEASLSVLKVRLAKAVAQHFGQFRVRRVAISKVLLEPT